MQRAAPVLFAILLGALATAIGMGVFLKLANDDRQRLSQEIATAHGAAEQALKEKEQIANEANKKVAAANDEVAKAQRVIEALDEEQRLLADARQLAKTPARELKGWQSVVSLPLGVSLSLPPQTLIESNDARALTATKEKGAAALPADTRWLSITPYNENLEQELELSLSTSTARSYLVDGRLLMGKIGTLPGNGMVAIFQVRQTASSTHLIWIKDPGTFGSGNGMERLLGTFSFK